MNRHHQGGALGPVGANSGLKLTWNWLRYSIRACSMDWPDYLRDEAAKYRQLAEQTDDPVVKNEMLELASVCDEVASNIEDHLTGG
jgi:hypothetical protein